ncbi:MAG TPA: zf-HC2 domain-containing protein [Candidatus Didemnitutus sp.]|nr:zf-HC2 domain-containing protein [Candidatus Didemnitutus sp.]
MNCQRVQESFIDYQDGSLPAPEAASLRAHLSSCPACQREWAALQEITSKLDRLPEPEPSARLREQFYAMLETHEEHAGSASPFAFVRGGIDRFFAALLPSRPAFQFGFAVALLLGGLFVGVRFLHPAPVVDERTREELRELHAQLDDVKHFSNVIFETQKSTSERLQTVLATMDLKTPDRKVLTDLVGALAFDPSVNVRLSAVEALAPHVNDQFVRVGLLSALQRESAPLVQVAMIELLTSAREPQASAMFEHLSHDESADKNVREAARRGLAVLRSPLPADNPKTSQIHPSKPALT